MHPLDIIEIAVVLAGIVFNACLLTVLQRVKTTPLKSYFALVKSLVLADLLLVVNHLFINLFHYFREIEPTGVTLKVTLIAHYFLYFVIFLHFIALEEHYVAIIKALHYSK